MNSIKIFLRISLYFSIFSSLAFTSKLDSMRSNIPFKSDTNKVLYYLEMTRIADFEDVKTKTEFIKLTLQLSEKLDYPFGIAKSYEYMAQLAELDKKMVQALEFNFKALDIFNQNNKSYESVTALVKIASIFEYFSDTKSATTYVKYAAQTLYKHPNPSKIKEAINFMIATQLRLNLLLDAKRAIDQYKDIFELSSDSNIGPNAMFYNHLCTYFIAQKEFYNALANARRAINSIEEKGYTWTSTYVYTLNNIGHCFKLIGKYDSSAFYIKKSLEFAIKNKLTFWEGLANRDLAELCFNQNEINDALKYANRYKEISESNYYIEDLKRANLLISELYLDKKDYFKAYDFMKNYVKTADSLMKKESSFIINNLLYKHGLEKAERMNEVLVSENKKKDLIIRDKQVMQFGLILGTFIIFIFAIFVIFLFVQYRINNDLLKLKTDEIIAKNEILETQNIMLEKLNDDKNGIIGVVSHDLKAPLNRIEGLLSLIYTDETFNADQTMYITLAQKELVDAKEMIKKILDSELKNADEKKLKLENIDLVQLLNDIIANYQIVASNKLIQVLRAFNYIKVEIKSDKNYVTRIIDNLLSNAIKFSESYKTVTVSLIDKHNEVEIIIADEGPGFTEEDKTHIYKKYQKLSAQPTRGENSTGLGLHIVHMLTQELGATINLQSEVGKGSQFRLVFKKESPII